MWKKFSRILSPRAGREQPAPINVSNLRSRTEPMSRRITWLTSLNRTLHSRRKAAMRQKGRLGLEPPEDREVPATLQITGGLLTYTAANGAANRLELSAVSSTYTFHDTAEKITVVGIAGASGSGTNTVTLPASAVPANGIAINLGDKNDALTIDSALHAVSVKAGAGNDAIDVGTPTGGILAGAFSAPVSVDGEGDTDTVRVNDPNGFLGSYTVTSSQVTRSGGFTMNYAGTENLTVNGGYFADAFDVRSTSATTRTTINGGAGNDAFRVGNTAGTMDDVLGMLTLNGGANDVGFEDQVTFTDVGSAAAHGYTFRADHA